MHDIYIQESFQLVFCDPYMATVARSYRCQILIAVKWLVTESVSFYSLEANLVILIFNERALDLRNCRRFTPFFRPFSSGEGRGFASFLLVRLSPYEGKRPIPFARMGNRTILYARIRIENWGDFLCEDRELLVHSAFFYQCLGIVFTYTDFDFRRLSILAK